MTYSKVTDVFKQKSKCCKSCCECTKMPKCAKDQLIQLLNFTVAKVIKNYSLDEVWHGDYIFILY